jgi:hypothetical protein
VTGPLSCYVQVDGVRVADGSPGEDAAAPFALAGLTVTWGRSTTLDQPPPATCSLTMVDDAASGPAFLGLLAVGRRLDVLTDATVYPDPSVSVVTDPSFEAGGPGQVASNAVVAVVGPAGGRYAQITPTNAGRGVRVIFPPAPFVPEGTDPTAWDAVPLTLPGQSWRVGCSVRLPPALGGAGAAGIVRPVTFSGPWASAAHVLTDPAWHVPPGTYAPTWAPVSGLLQPPPAVWLGVAVDLYPTGPSWDAVDPALTWDAVDPALTWAQLAETGVDDLVVLAPAAGADRLAVVFGGRITDLSAQHTDDDRTLVAITAQDHTAELANRDVGDQPWPAEPLGARAQRIVTLAGQSTALTVAPGIAGVQVTAMDVDAQPSTGLLAELATSADAVLWSAVHLTTGQYLLMEDTAARAALAKLAMVDGVVTIVPAGPAAGAVQLSACDVLLDPVRWVQDVADVATRVAVRWLEQTTPDTTEHTETVTDAGLLAAMGVRRIGIGTVLTSSADALALANRVLARTSDLGWRIGGLTWATGLDPLDPGQVAAAFALLDGTTRLGAAIQLTDLPAWSPAPESTTGLFLEGGTYTFTDAAWTLDLTVSRAIAQGSSLPWTALDPGWSWDEFDPAVSWNDLAGVGPGT